MKPKGCLLLIIIFVAFVIIIVLRLPKGDHYNDPYFQKIRTGVLGKISFKGKVINYDIVHNEQLGKDYSVICIKLDYSNTDSFYYFQVYSSKNSKPGKVTLGKEALHKNRLFEWCMEARVQVWFCSLNDNPFGGGIANPA